MPNKFTFKDIGCNGANISPALSWSDPPSETTSFALMARDPDAYTGGAGMPSNATALPAGFLINLNIIGQARLSVRFGRAP